jgi:haloacetate dehalogenase
MFEGFERKVVDVGEVSINSMVGGSGPPVLLLHGYPQNLAMWADVAPRLAHRFTVVCADLRGYGDSTKPKCLPDNSNYGFRTMAKDQVALMKALGFEQFHLVGHDRGGRTAYRLALDHGHAVTSLAVLDIVPTYAMFQDIDSLSARLYWHWSFLTLPEPFPEGVIGANPDFFFEAMLGAWGGAQLSGFSAEQLADYRRCWRNPATIHGMCSDYRAGATVDFAHDMADVAAGKKIDCPTLALWGSNGAPVRRFDVAAEWRKICTDVQSATIEGSHFFIDQSPAETAKELLCFLAG